MFSVRGHRCLWQQTEHVPRVGVAAAHQAPTCHGFAPAVRRRRHRCWRLASSLPRSAGAALALSRRIERASAQAAGRRRTGHPALGRRVRAAGAVQPPRSCRLVTATAGGGIFVAGDGCDHLAAAIERRAVERTAAIVRLEQAEIRRTYWRHRNCLPPPASSLCCATPVAGTTNCHRRWSTWCRAGATGVNVVSSDTIAVVPGDAHRGGHDGRRRRSQPARSCHQAATASPEPCCRIARRHCGHTGVLPAALSWCQAVRIGQQPRHG